MRLSTKSPKLFFGCSGVFLTDIFNTISDSTFYQPFHTILRLQIRNRNPNIPCQSPVLLLNDQRGKFKLYRLCIAKYVLSLNKKKMEEFEISSVCQCCAVVLNQT